MKVTIVLSAVVLFFSSADHVTLSPSGFDVTGTRIVRETPPTAEEIVLRETTRLTGAQLKTIEERLARS